MKKIIYTFSIVSFISLMYSCVSVKEIGKINMISNRNIDPNLKYSLVTTYSGGSDRELKKSDAKTIEDAVDNTVKKIPGGEFLMNAKLYLIQHGKSTYYFAVEGDVWGSGAQASYRGFKVGDKVTWKNKSALGLLSSTKKILNGKNTDKKFLTGVITGLKDDKTCLVKVDDEENVIMEITYDELTKTN